MKIADGEMANLDSSSFEMPTTVDPGVAQSPPIYQADPGVKTLSPSASTDVLQTMKADVDALQAKRDAENKKYVQNNYWKMTLSSGIGAVGAIAGIVLAVKRKSGFWGGVGWFIVGSMAGSAAGYVAGTFADGKPKA